MQGHVVLSGSQFAFQDLKNWGMLIQISIFSQSSHACCSDAVATISVRFCENAKSFNIGTGILTLLLSESLNRFLGGWHEELKKRSIIETKKTANLAERTGIISP
jgi:hypothetical protein